MKLQSWNIIIYGYIFKNLSESVKFWSEKSNLSFSNNVFEFDKYNNGLMLFMKLFFWSFIAFGLKNKVEIEYLNTDSRINKLFPVKRGDVEYNVNKDKETAVKFKMKNDIWYLINFF